MTRPPPPTDEDNKDGRKAGDQRHRTSIAAKSDFTTDLLIFRRIFRISGVNQCEDQEVPNFPNIFCKFPNF